MGEAPKASLLSSPGEASEVVGWRRGTRSVEQEKGEDDRGGGVGRLVWADGQLGRLAQWGKGFLSLPSTFLFFLFLIYSCFANCLATMRVL